MSPSAGIHVKTQQMSYVARMLGSESVGMTHSSADRRPSLRGPPPACASARSVPPWFGVLRVWCTCAVKVMARVRPSTAAGTFFARLLDRKEHVVWVCEMIHTRHGHSSSGRYWLGSGVPDWQKWRELPQLQVFRKTGGKSVWLRNRTTEPWKL